MIVEIIFLKKGILFLYYSAALSHAGVWKLGLEVVTPLVTRRVSWVYAIFLWYLPSPKARKKAQSHFVSWGQSDFEFIPLRYHSY